ncbi:uncharacterized protein LOC110098209 [Dendrobium catenatum]|uniref:uncharacterized protein LOC110098209 n=1 Tax=Dendrobium catenatum TaxID=906689 RepID=UPI0009F3B8CE|nr:uncharacterized protein LOC110098209 [Dendrobium catenatum]
MTSKEAVHRTDLAIARWFYDSCIPFNPINSPFAQKAIVVVAVIGPGYKLPSYHRLRVNLLWDAKEECKLLIESYRKIWKETGCTLITDGWTDIRNMTLINFLIYCPRGVSFLKSVDASDVIKDATTLWSLFTDIVEWVGPENIVHFITDNATNYKKASELLHEKYGNIYWSPCVAHCINLILKDIGSMPYITELARKASNVTIFIYNHAFILAWLRKTKDWTEIVRPGVIRFATTFITLKSVHDHKHDLQAFITSKAYIDSKLSKTMKGKEAASIILDAKFLDDRFIISKLSEPLIRLLRIVDADEKPSLGYLYDDEDNLSNICDEDDIPCEDAEVSGMQDFGEEDFVVESMTTNGHRPPAAGGPIEDQRSLGRPIIEGARDVSSSPPTFGDDRSIIFPGLKTSAMVNKLLIINEGGQVKKKQLLEVPGKGKAN